MIYRDQTPRKSQKSDPVGEVGLMIDAMALASMAPDGGNREPEKGWDAAGAIEEWEKTLVRFARRPTASPSRSSR
jgi:hypothetical protein